ncbi:MAG: hypothetical protein U0271_48430 [Polyangiaceae bacterium]
MSDTLDGFILADRVVTCDPARATPSDPLGVVEAGFVELEGGRVRAVGLERELGADARARIRARASLLTPGLVDAHTHAAWAGSRHVEYALRMKGADYSRSRAPAASSRRCAPCARVRPWNSRVSSRAGSRAWPRSA